MKSFYTLISGAVLQMMKSATAGVKEGLPLLGYESHVSQSLTAHVKACLALVKTYTSPPIGSMFLLMQNSLCY